MSPTNHVPVCKCPFHIRTEFFGKLTTTENPEEWAVWRETYSPVVEGTTVTYKHFVGLRTSESSHTYVVLCTSILAPEAEAYGG